MEASLWLLPTLMLMISNAREQPKPSDNWARALCVTYMFMNFSAFSKANKMNLSLSCLMPTSVLVYAQEEILCGKETDRQKMEREINCLEENKLSGRERTKKRLKCEAWWAKLTLFPHSGWGEVGESSHFHCQLTNGFSGHRASRRAEPAPICPTASRKARPHYVTIPEPAP